MMLHYVLNMQPNPTVQFQRFLTSLYRVAGLDAVLVPLRVDDETTIEPKFVAEPEQLKNADPFTPLMVLNSAQILLDYQRSFLEQRLGAVLRPCELRAVTALQEKNLVDMAAFLKIGVDCIGTFELGDNEWSVTPHPKAEDTLRFARQGGVNLYRYRPACQMCVDPTPTNADLTVDLLGLPARSKIVISGSNEVTERYHLAELTHGLATPELIQQRDRVRHQVIARRDRTRLRLAEMLRSEFAMDVDSLAAHLAECETCQSCLEVCPIFKHIVPEPTAMIQSESIEWIMGCSGCGMCEAVCSDHHPLTQIINRVRTAIVDALDESTII